MQWAPPCGESSGNGSFRVELRTAASGRVREEPDDCCLSARLQCRLSCVLIAKSCDRARPVALLRVAGLGAPELSFNVTPLRSPAAVRTWHHSAASRTKPQRRRRQVRADVARGCFEFQLALPGGVALHAFVGQRRAGDVATHLRQRSTGGWRAVNRGVQAKTLHVGAHRMKPWSEIMRVKAALLSTRCRESGR